MSANNPVVDLALDTINKEKQALVFVNTRASAEKVAEDISKKLKDTETGPGLSEKTLKALQRPTRQCQRLSKIIMKGIAFHHAGLHPKQRELIEDNFKSGEIKIICCTPTLCLSKDTRVWQDMSEPLVSDIDIKKPVFGLDKNDILSIKIKNIHKMWNFSKLIRLKSSLGYSIKVTPEHKMLIKRDGKRRVITARHIKKTDKIATISRLKIPKKTRPSIRTFVKDNELPMTNKRIDEEVCYLIGVMLGDGYSGAETIDNKIKYKGSPCIVGVDKEIFDRTIMACKDMGLAHKMGKNYNGTAQLILGKNKWFRELLVNCGVEKGENKYIDDRLMRLNLSKISELLKGLFDTDGFVDRRNGVGFSNTSKRLVLQIQKLLLRFGIISRIRKRPKNSMKIYTKTYRTKESFELLINHKTSILKYYKYVGFHIKRKQDSLENHIAKIVSNYHFVRCPKCKYKIFKDLFSGRTQHQKIWGMTKKKVIGLLGDKIELSSREIRRLIKKGPKKAERRLNNHYELIQKKRVGNGAKTDWIWSLNNIGRWVYSELIKKNRPLDEFLRIQFCPLCKTELDVVIKKGWKNKDFEGDIFWDKLNKIEDVACEEEVYDLEMPKAPKNDHMFVANGFIVHNSQGVDLPAFRAIIRDLKRYGGPWGLSWIPVLEYEQMAGRAGRPKFDKFGEAIVIAGTEADKDEIYDRYLRGTPEDIYSKLAVEPVLRTYLLSLIASNFVNTKKQILDFFSKTYWAFQYKDMDKMEYIITKMLDLLTDYEFILSKDKEDFVSADTIGDEKFRPTLIGKRVAELYLDPLTAYNLMQGLRKASSKQASNFSYLHLISSTLEIRPLLRVKTREFDDTQREFLRYDEELITEEPDPYSTEYDDFVNTIKTTLFFTDWIKEKDEEDLFERFDIRPGEIKAKLDIADWLLYSAQELAKLMQFQPILKDLMKLRLRVKHGIKEELITLVKLKNIGRVRARILYRNNIKTIGDIKRADPSSLTSLLGKKTAESIKQQVGQEVIPIKKNKRKGQKNVEDY